MLKELILAWAVSKLQKRRRAANARLFYKEAEKLAREVGATKHSIITTGVEPNNSKQMAGVVVGLVLLGALIGASKQKKLYASTPKFGEYLLYLLLPKRDRENLIGDLAEEYVEVQLKFGTMAANIWYYKQVFTSAWPLILKAIRIGLIAWVGEWIRRRI